MRRTSRDIRLANRFAVIGDFGSSTTLERDVAIFVKSWSPDFIITVKDNGAGISPEDLPRIWDRLYRGDKSRNEKGLGLGLSLVKAVVQAHRGSVEVTSEPDRGSVFTVRLPATQARKQEASAIAAGVPVARR